MATMTLTHDELTDRADRLAEVSLKMLELLDEAEEIVRGTDEEGRAQAYWLAHIRSAITQENRYDVTMQIAIDALRGEDADD